MQKRLARELEAMRKLPNLSVEEVEEVPTLSMPNLNDKIDHQAWRVQQIGPPGTPYEGGVYEWEVTFPKDYPFKPPQTFLKTEVYHVNLTMANKRALRATAWFSGGGDWSPQIKVADIFAAIGQVMVEPYTGILKGSELIDAEFKKTVPPATNRIQILVKTLIGRTIIVPCGAADSVLTLKSVVEEMEGIPIREQRLICAGKKMENTQSLADYNIVDGSTLHIVLQIGGPPSLDSTIDVDLCRLYTSDKVAFEATAAKCRDEHATLEFNGHRIVVSVLMPEHETGQIACTRIDGSEIFSWQAAPSDLRVGSIRDAVAQQLEVASARVALVLKGEVVTASAHDTKTLAKAVAMISTASSDPE